MLRHFHRQFVTCFPRRLRNGQGIKNVREFPWRKLNVDDRSNDLYDFSVSSIGTHPYAPWLEEVGEPS